MTSQISFSQLSRSVRALLGDLHHLIFLKPRARDFLKFGLALVRLRVRPGNARSWSGKLNEIRLGSSRLLYRCTYADVATIKEVWLDRAYALPVGALPEHILDLGGHIGIAAVWFHYRYPDAVIVSVEPDPANAALASENRTRNSLRGALVVAAVGQSREPLLALQRNVPSHSIRTGHLEGLVANDVTAVATVTLGQLVGQFFPEGVDLLKLDVEGAEEEIISSSREIFPAIRMVLAEFHPPAVDPIHLIAVLVSCGFLHQIPSDTANNPLHLFTREAFARDEEIAGEAAASPAQKATASTTASTTVI
ncbi:MAG TPA: FkbM family methyltransferase [Acidimicrobiales bacterium]|nr:FkbM family methyltransferase [Acidimicrobiales bacterium]